MILAPLTLARCSPTSTTDWEYFPSSPRHRIVLRFCQDRKRLGSAEQLENRIRPIRIEAPGGSIDTV